MNENQVTYFGETDFRNERKRFGIKALDRLRHVYIIGKTGVGKSTMLENMAVQDILSGNGMGFFDPHGKSAELFLDYVPEHRVQDVVYFAPFDTGYPISFNILETVEADKRHFVANGILSVFKKIWADKFSDRMEYILGNTILALIEYPDATMLGINRMLTDKEYRKKVIDNITDPSVRAFWVDEYLTWDDRYAREAGASIQNKVGQFTSNPLIRNIVGQPRNTLDLRKLMDEGKILIANLSKGQLGDENSRLLGGLLNTKIYLEAMSRAELSQSQLAAVPPFYLYVDEFQNFASESFADILSEARKYKLSLTMAHQYVQQMPDAVREAVFGNVGTMVTFRIGPEDAEYLERQFAPVFTAEDLANLGAYQIYLSLMIDGIGSKPFSANTLPPIPKPEISFKQQVLEASRQQFALSRSDVEAAIEEWYTPIPSEKQIQHQQYLREKRIEIESKGGVWRDPKTGEPQSPLPESVQKNNKNKTAKDNNPRQNSAAASSGMATEAKVAVPEKQAPGGIEESSIKGKDAPRRDADKKSTSRDDKSHKRRRDDRRTPKERAASFVPDADSEFEQLVARATNQEPETKSGSSYGADSKQQRPEEGTANTGDTRERQGVRPRGVRDQEKTGPTKRNRDQEKTDTPRPVSNDSREAKPEHKAALRDLLARVKQESTKPEKSLENEKGRQENTVSAKTASVSLQNLLHQVVHEKEDNANEQNQSSQQVPAPDFVVQGGQPDNTGRAPLVSRRNPVEVPPSVLTKPQTPREVPEDILRSILQ